MQKYYRADSIRDAHRALRDSEDAEVIAGGQEVMLDLRRGEMSPTTLVDISDVDQLCEITHTEDAVRIGACVTYRDLETDAELRTAIPYFVEAVEDIAGRQVRNYGTLGGALCDADPVFDMPAVLLTLDAGVTARSGDETRTIPVSGFYTGHCDTDLAPEEILTTIRVPKLSPRTGGTYRSMTPRDGDATVAGVAVRLGLDETGLCQTARIGLTSAGAIPTRASDAESVLEGTEIADTQIDAAVSSLRSNLDLLPDPLFSRTYRKTVFTRLTTQAIRDVRTQLLGDAE